MNKPLTKKQIETLEFMIKFLNETGRKPTVREIMHHLGLSSTSVVYSRIKNLERNIGLCPWCTHPFPKEKQKRLDK